MRGLISSDPWMMQVLQVAETLQLPQWMIGAGFVRSKVWDTLSGFEHVHGTDVDLIYFDPSDVNEETEKKYDALLRRQFDLDWSTKNQARMHVMKGLEPYTSSEDGMAHWTETATAVAVKIENGNIVLIAPYGIDDLVNMVVRSCPKWPAGEMLMLQRVADKRWLEKWPKLKVVRQT